jgi:phosphoribosylanthranilate isomerase
MVVKICGITNLDDALAAVDAGAGMLGFNFYPKSPRCITLDACRHICEAISHLQSPVTTVGIFVNLPPGHVAAVLDECGLDMAQLHGDEPPEHLRVLWGRGFKGLRGPPAGDLHGYAVSSPGYPSLLLDTASATLYGGTGQTGDWLRARSIAARYPILLAGGLNSENVAEAVVQVRPWGVDTASGVESAPGRKDHHKLRAFVAAAREAANSQLPITNAAIGNR